jgi:hypothetical protein
MLNSKTNYKVIKSSKLETKAMADIKYILYHSLYDFKSEELLRRALRAAGRKIVDTMQPICCD